MDDLKLIIDLHRDAARQGPGGDAQTRLAISLAGLQGKAALRIADLGCGTGASARVLAQDLDAHVDAVDFLPEFLEVLEQSAAEAGLSDRITTHAVSMDALPFEQGAFDAIWSEGAIYNLGFEAGVAAWRHYLKPGGILAVSELTWLTGQRPEELTTHWVEAYPEVDTAAAKLAVLERLGFAPLGYFALPETCWLDNYYRPIESRIDRFLEQYENAEAAQALVDAERAEISLYERHRDYVSYGFYIAKYIGPNAG